MRVNRTRVTYYVTMPVTVTVLGTIIAVTTTTTKSKKKMDSSL